jgi:RNA polymerase sigma factor (sigma-70 family)
MAMVRQLGELVIPQLHTAQSAQQKGEAQPQKDQEEDQERARLEGPPWHRPSWYLEAYRRYTPALSRLSQRLFASTTIRESGGGPDDLLNQTWIRAWECATQFAPPLYCSCLIIPGVGCSSGGEYLDPDDPDRIERSDRLLRSAQTLQTTRISEQGLCSCCRPAFRAYYSWLRQIMRRLFLDYYVRQAKKRQAILGDRIRPISAFEEEVVAQATGFWQLDPEVLADEPEYCYLQQEHLGEMRCLIQQCLAQLSPRSRELIELYYFAGWETELVARFLGRSRGAVKRGLWQSVQQLRRLARQYLVTRGWTVRELFSLV